MASLVVSFRRLTSSLNHSASPEEAPEPSSDNMQQAMLIGNIVEKVARHTPWKSPCLAQVLATQRMLAIRGIPGVFYLGVRNKSVDEIETPGLDAHAWLKCGSQIVNGAAGSESFTIVSSWSW